MARLSDLELYGSLDLTIEDRAWLRSLLDALDKDAERLNVVREGVLCRLRFDPGHWIGDQDWQGQLVVVEKAEGHDSFLVRRYGETPEFGKIVNGHWRLALVGPENLERIA